MYWVRFIGVAPVFVECIAIKRRNVESGLLGACMFVLTHSAIRPSQQWDTIAGWDGQFTNLHNILVLLLHTKLFLLFRIQLLPGPLYIAFYSVAEKDLVASILFVIFYLLYFSYLWAVLFLVFYLCYIFLYLWAIKFLVFYLCYIFHISTCLVMSGLIIL